MKNLLLLIMLFSGISVKAESTTLITLSSESEPNKYAYLGVNTDSNNRLHEIFYKGADGKTENFSLSRLAKSQVIFSKKGYNLVSIRVPSSSATSASLNINYVQNVFYNESKSRSFSIRFNAHVHKYEIYDENQRQFTRAHVTTHHNLVGVATGIEEIRTQ